MIECCRCNSEVKLVAGEYGLVFPDNKPAHISAQACEDALRAAFQRKLTAVREAGDRERAADALREKESMAAGEVIRKEKATKDQQAEEAKVKAAQHPKPEAKAEHVDFAADRGESGETRAQQAAHFGKTPEDAPKRGR